MPFKTIRDLGDEITPDYFVALDEANKLAVIDTEGDLVFFAPPSLLALEESMADPILVEVAELIVMARGQSWARGYRIGTQEMRTGLQTLLGVDKIVIALERIADQGLRI